MNKLILNLITLLMLAFLAFACEKEDNNKLEKDGNYQTETLIQQQKFYGGVINDAGLLVTLRAPLSKGVNGYHVNPEIVFLDENGDDKNSFYVDESINFETGLKGPAEIDDTELMVPVGLNVDFAKNSSGDIFMSNNRDRYIYKIKDNQLVKFCEVGFNIQSIFCDKESNIYALKAPVFTNETYELITPPVIFKISPAGVNTIYFTFPDSYSYQFGTGFYFDYDNNNTAYLSPNSMSLYIDKNATVFVSMMVLDKVFTVNGAELQVVAKVEAPTDLFIDKSGDLFILQAPCFPTNKGSVKSQLPMKLSNYTKDLSIYEIYDFKWSNVATGSAGGYYQSAETNLLTAYDKERDVIYILNPLNNCVEKLY